MLGPFDANPPNAIINIFPLNTAAKKGSVDRRIIMDLSWPRGRSVNDGICILGNAAAVHYPSIDNLLNIVVDLGPSCLLFKTDFSRAYRLLPTCPGDLGLLGYS